MVSLEKLTQRTSEAARVPSTENERARAALRADEILAAWRQAQVDAFFDGVEPILSLPGRGS